MLTYLGRVNKKKRMNEIWQEKGDIINGNPSFDIILFLAEEEGL